MMEVDRQRKYCLDFEKILLLQLILFQQVSDIEINWQAKLLDLSSPEVIAWFDEIHAMVTV